MEIDWRHFVTHGGVLMLALAMLCIGASAYTLVHGFEQQGWAQVPGVVVRARRVAPAEPGKRWRESFVYEYRVDSRRYTAERYSFATIGGEQSVGLERYAPGDPVTVYYDPDDPAVAVLERRKPGAFVFAVGAFGLLFLLGSIGSLLARDATAPFTRAGIARLTKALRAPPEPAAGAAGSARFPDDAWARSLRRVEESLRESLLSGALELERAAALLEDATELDREICRGLARELAAGRAIDLSPRSIEALSGSGTGTAER